jgi:hypothetical protein
MPVPTLAPPWLTILRRPSPLPWIRSPSLDKLWVEKEEASSVAEEETCDDDDDVVWSEERPDVMPPGIICEELPVGEIPSCDGLEREVKWAPAAVPGVDRLAAPAEGNWEEELEEYEDWWEEEARFWSGSTWDSVAELEYDGVRWSTLAYDNVGTVYCCEEVEKAPGESEERPCCEEVEKGEPSSLVELEYEDCWEEDFWKPPGISEAEELEENEETPPGVDTVYCCVVTSPGVAKECDVVLMAAMPAPTPEPVPAPKPTPVPPWEAILRRPSPLPCRRCLSVDKSWVE